MEKVTAFPRPNRCSYVDRNYRAKVVFGVIITCGALWAAVIWAAIHYL